MCKKSNIADRNKWCSVMLPSVPSNVFCAILLRWLCEAIEGSLYKEQLDFADGTYASNRYSH